MFRFNRKNKKTGEIEEQEVSQEEFDQLEENSQTLAEIQSIFGEGVQSNDFNLVEAIQNAINLSSAVADAFGEAAEAEDFDLSARVQELSALEQEHSEISQLVEHLPGESLADKVKGIKPETKTTTTTDAPPEQTADKKAFQSFEHNRKMLRELRSIGVTVVGVDYKELSKN